MQTLDPDQELIRQAREFARCDLLPEAEWLDTRPPVPLVLSQLLHKAGLANWWLPPQYGGAGVCLQTGVDIVSELSYGDAGFAFGSFLSILGTTMLERFGTPELCDRWLAPMGANGGCCAVVISEELAGSQLGQMATTYRAQGADLVIDGTKYFSTNSAAADFLLVAARSAEDPDSFSVILVPRDTPGLEITSRWDMIGMRGSATYRVALHGVTVPATNALRGHGLRVLEVGLNASRTLIAATAIGMARRVRDLCLEYAADKRIKGSTLATNDVFAGKLGQLEMLIDVMRNQCRAAAAEFDRLGADPQSNELYRVGTIRSALAAKMYCGQAGWEVATMGSQMFGGLGYTHEHPIGKLVRDLRYVGLVEGGDEVIRDLIYTRFVVPAAKRL